MRAQLWLLRQRWSDPRDSEARLLQLGVGGAALGDQPAWKRPWPDQMAAPAVEAAASLFLDATQAAGGGEQVFWLAGQVGCNHLEGLPSPAIRARQVPQWEVHTGQEAAAPAIWGPIQRPLGHPTHTHTPWGKGEPVVGPLRPVLGSGGGANGQVYFMPPNSELGGPGWTEGSGTCLARGAPRWPWAGARAGWHHPWLWKWMGRSAPLPKGGTQCTSGGLGGRAPPPEPLN